MLLKYKNIHRLILFILLVVLCFGCKNTKTELDEFLYQMDKALSDRERSRLIECSDIECIVSFFMSHPHDSEIIQLFKKIPKKLTDSLDSMGVGNNRVIALLTCYNYKQNDKSISLKEILEKINDYDKKEEQASDQRALESIEGLLK